MTGGTPRGAVARPPGEWIRRGLCLEVGPELWTSADASGRPLAKHLCRFHCEVLDECLAWSWEYLTISVVQGGEVWGDRGQPIRSAVARSCTRCTGEGAAVGS
jgi:hypothetical protein